MSIEKESDVKALAIQKLRKELGLTQAAFWSQIGVAMQRGHRYEIGITKKIPVQVQRLVFLHYVIGIPTNAPPEELRAIFEKINTKLELNKHLKQAEKSIQSVKDTLNVQSRTHPGKSS